MTCKTSLFFSFLFSAVGLAAESQPSADEVAELVEAGKKQYLVTCVACHQPTGAGLPAVFPPLTKSEYVGGDPRRLVAIVLFGVMGPITVDGKPFNNMMPPQAALLKDDQIAAVLTYVRKSFGNEAPAITPDAVAKVRAEFSGRTAPWNEADLKAWK